MKLSEAKRRQEVKLKTTAENITSRSGLLLVEELVQRLGVAEMIAERLRLKERACGYCESAHILSLVYALRDGASCLDDVQRLRDDAETQAILQLVDGVPHPTTVGDFLRRFRLEDIEQFEELLRELGKKTHKLDAYPKPKLTIDLDSKVAEKYGHQEGGSSPIRN